MSETELHPATDPDVRKTGLGGSDMPTILGLNPYKSAFALWLEKLGRGPEFHGNEATWFGNQMEDIIAQRWADDHNQKIQRKNITARHRDHDWAMAHIDRKIVGVKECLEVKTTIITDDWGEQGTDQVPSHILPQCHHQLWVEDYERCHVTVAFLHQRKIANYVVERSAQWDSILEIVGSEFWNRVKTEQEPEIDFSKKYALAELKNAYNIDDQLIIDLEDRALELHETEQKLRSWAKTYSDAADTAKAELLHMTGSAWLARLPDGTFYKRQKTKRAAFSVEATEYISFRHIKKAPKGVETE